MEKSAKAVIAHLAQTFPGLTATFTYREIMALRQKGVTIDTFSIRKPERNKISKEAIHLIDTTFYILPPSWLKFLKAQFYFLIRHFPKSAKTLIYVLIRPGMKFSHKYRTFIHFFLALYLAAEIKKRNIKHIHTHSMSNPATVAMIISRLLGITFSCTAHARDIFMDPILLKEKLETSKFVITISQYNRNYLKQYSSTSKIDVVYSGLDLDHFTPRSGVRVKNIPMILSVGRLVEKKGLIYLIQACRILLERGYEFRCEIVGDGPQRNFLDRMIIEYCLNNNVTLEGSVLQEDLKEYWQRATIFVLPCVISKGGDRDGIPVALMEAMALKVPVISTSIAGIPELIQHGHSGLLTRPEDPHALSNLIIQLLGNPELQEQIKYNARLTVEKMFNLRENISQLIDVYSQYCLIE